MLARVTNISDAGVKGPGCNVMVAPWQVVSVFRLRIMGRLLGSEGSSDRSDRVNNGEGYCLIHFLVKGQYMNWRIELCNWKVILISLQKFVLSECIQFSKQLLTDDY